MNNRIAIILSIVFLHSGCKKYVQIETPPALVVTSKVFANASTATSAMVSIYLAMKLESYNMSQSAGLLSDELDGSYSSNTEVLQYYRNSMVATNKYAGPWISAYNYIYQCNAIIEGVDKYSNFDARIRSQLIGEAKFVRAFWYFYLINCYGDVPIITSTEYTINALASRSPQSKAYEQILADLQSAVSSLSDHFVDASDTAVSTSRIRPCRWAALALLSRIALYNKDFTSAKSAATQVIENTNLFKLEDNLNDVFLPNSSEAIWQLAVPLPLDDGINTADGNGFILTSAPSSGPTNTVVISQQLISAFDSGDNRKQAWIGSIPIESDTFYFPFKYKVYLSNTADEYTMMLRLAEQYLIRAEALAQLGDFDGAISDLNVIRRRAGLSDFMGAKDKPSILAAVMHERQVELFTEWGHRWFDLIRTENIDNIMNIVTPLKGGVWSHEGRLFPVPQSERVVDYNLTQNPGY